MTALLLALACSESQLGVRNEAPEVTIIRPVDGASFDPTADVALCVQVADNSPLDDLALLVESDVGGVLADGGAEGCEGGNAGWTLALSDATQTLSVFATDPNGRAGSASAILVPAANEPPSCGIAEPLDGQAYEAGQRVDIVAHGDDEDTGPSSLSASLTSSLDGEVWSGQPDGDGSITAAFIPATAGDSTLTLAVTDPRGEKATCLASIYVNPCLDEDEDGWNTCEGDCDDDDATAWPGADELADGADNDCDGDVDEGTSLVDDDGDGWSELEGDCDDDDASVNPGEAERWYDGTDQDCDGADDDRDGDGWGIADDCDDDDASVAPGVYDACYDGLDADCGGDDDYDCDGDGVEARAYGGDDCNDADATSYPGATETWYDGIDQDCSGGSDYDADGDSYTASAYGGADCDDGDATVSPAAVETWYDGIDEDCDGGSDDDQDGDGYDAEGYGGTDCDDTDANVNSAASEVWYDGIDQDCDGWSDDDQDGDGEDDEARGGADCDDTDPAVYSTAPEVRDAADNDCDGGCDEGLFSAGDLVITEFMKDPTTVADSEGEWFEVYNASGVDIRMCGWTIHDEGGDTFTMISEAYVAAGDYAVFGRSASTSANGGVSVDYVYGTGMQLGNGADEIVLEESGTEVDRVEYDDGVSWPDPSGLAVSLDPAAIDATSNDDGGNWCSATSAYGLGDKGTPGSANDGC